MNGLKTAVVSDEMIKKDQEQLKKLEDIFNVSYNGIPSFCRGISKEIADSIFESLEKSLEKVKQAKGAEREKLYSDFEKQRKLAASMVNSYAQAYTSWKEGVSKSATFIGDMVFIKEKMTFVDNLVSASMTALMFSGTVAKAAKISSKPFISYIEKKKLEEFIRKEIEFYTRLTVRSSQYDLLQAFDSIRIIHKTKKFPIDELKQFFSDLDKVRLLNISSSQRANFILKTMLSTIERAELTESQKIIYDAMSKLDFSLHKIHESYKILNDAMRNVSNLAKKGDAEKIANEVLDFINDFDNAREYVSQSLLFDTPNIINQTHGLELRLTNEAMITYKQEIALALKEKRAGGLPLGDHFRHELSNSLTLPRAVVSFLKEGARNIKYPAL
jgi:hypothetical protein